jgi:hypothetical protein
MKVYLSRSKGARLCQKTLAIDAPAADWLVRFCRDVTTAARILHALKFAELWQKARKNKELGRHRTLRTI